MGVLSTEVEQEWNVVLTQARNFAERENYSDAVARMKELCESVSQTLGSLDDSKQRLKAEQFLALSERQLTNYQVQYDTWNNAIAERRQAVIDGAAEEMAWPQPNPPPSPPLSNDG